MSEPALNMDMVSALRAKSDVTVTDSSIEVACVGQLVRRFACRTTVSRGLLANLQRWYGVPIAAFYPPTRVKAESSASRK